MDLNFNVFIFIISQSLLPPHPPSPINLLRYINYFRMIELDKLLNIKLFEYLNNFSVIQVHPLNQIAPILGIGIK